VQLPDARQIETRDCHIFGSAQRLQNMSANRIAASRSAWSRTSPSTRRIPLAPILCLRRLLGALRSQRYCDHSTCLSRWARGVPANVYDDHPRRVTTPIFLIIFISCRFAVHPNPEPTELSCAIPSSPAHARQKTSQHLSVHKP